MNYCAELFMEFLESVSHAAGTRFLSGHVLSGLIVFWQEKDSDASSMGIEGWMALPILEGRDLWCGLGSMHGPRRDIFIETRSPLTPMDIFGTSRLHGLKIQNVVVIDTPFGYLVLWKAMWQCNLFWSVIDLNTPKLG
jgi:hypothetical protein